jgi:hypothetical protein
MEGAMGAMRRTLPALLLMSAMMTLAAALHPTVRR